jgi:5-methylcytosine-specific restriction endonuclease McrA
MLSLTKPSQGNLDKYFNLIESYITKALGKSAINRAARNYLTTSKIKEIIQSEPHNLMRFHRDIIPLLGNGFSIAGYKSYLVAKAKRKWNRIATETLLINRYSPQLKELDKVFDYEKIISGKKKVSYELALLLDRNTCTYCNRLYTITVLKNAKTASGVTRPQFDHWYSKKRYPVLALSFYNLIPSCSVCNSTIKGDTDFQLTTHYHPYVDSFLNEFNFGYHLESVFKNNVVLKYPSGSNKARKTLEEFKIGEIYNGHSLLELKDLIELKKKYSDTYLETLFKDLFKGLSVHPHKAYRYLFGAEFEDDIFHKRPMSKFKKDIITELRLLDM